MSGRSEVERTEALLWEAVRAFYGPGLSPKAQADAAVVEALKAYRAAVAAEVLAPPERGLAAAA